MISKLLRLYKRTHGLRQICNIAVYISHSACTIHLLNLPDKNAGRDIVHGLKHLEEIGESWLCARRTLSILHLVAKRWSIEVPEEAEKTFKRTEGKFGTFKDVETPPKQENQMPSPTPIQPLPPPVTKPDVETNVQHDFKVANGVNGMNGVPTNGFFPNNAPLSSPIPTPDVPSINGALGMPPQSAPAFGNKPRQHGYVMPQAQQSQTGQQRSPPQGFWNQSQNQTNPVSQPTTSPTMLFGGVDSLIQDQEWWLRDSNQMFANWNGMEQDAVMSGNSGFDMGTGNMGYGNVAYGMNGMNGMNGTGNVNGAMGFKR